MASNRMLSGTKRWEILSILLILLLAALVDSRGPARPAGGHDTHSVVRNSVHGGDEKTRPNGSLLKHPGVKHNNQSALPRKHHAGSVPVYEACRAPGSFSLTFDDGPSEYSTALDATLGRNKVKASFYINGNNAGCIYDYADLLLRRFKAGHLIASHTWSHVHLNQGSYEAISHQLQLLEDAMIKILGVKPLYFRPPYGEYNDLTLQVLHDRGYKGMILWSRDSQDSADAPPSASQMVSDYRTYPNGTIVLHHETQALTVDQVIPRALPILREKRLNLITSPECLDLGSNPSDWYVAVQQPGSRDASWTCAGTPTSESYHP